MRLIRLKAMMNFVDDKKLFYHLIPFENFSHNLIVRDFSVLSRILSRNLAAYPICLFQKFLSIFACIGSS
jgi:hypothetical protein